MHEKVLYRSYTGPIRSVHGPGLSFYQRHRVAPSTTCSKWGKSLSQPRVHCHANANATGTPDPLARTAAIYPELVRASLQHTRHLVGYLHLPPFPPPQLHASTGPGSLGPIRTGGDRADANPLGFLGPCANPNLSLASTICLSPLAFRSSQPELAAMIPTPEPAWIPATHLDRYPQDTEHAAGTLTDTNHRLSPRPLEEIRILNRCNHAFHASCLASWFQYGQFRCPICQASYSPV